MKTYTVYWRFKGKEYRLLPWNSSKITATSKKEAKEYVKSSLENVKIIRID